MNSTDIEDILTLLEDDDPAKAIDPRALLIRWANKQDAWVRFIAGQVLATMQPCTDTQVMDALTILKAEKRLSSEALPDVPELILTDQGPASEDALVLTKMTNVCDVNALSSDEQIEFNDGLTILFGENGSGKTGYARILKAMVAVRTAGDVLPNARSGGEPGVPCAAITYQLGDSSKSVVWKNERGLAPFTRISVFDDPAVNLHVDGELGYVYTPAEISIFGFVSDAVKAVQSLLNVEAQAEKPRNNPFIATFTRGTLAYPIIEILGAETDLTELERLATVEDSADDDLAKLQEEVAALRGGGLDAIAQNLKRQTDSLATTVGVLRALVAFNPGAYITARDALLAAEAERRKVREELFSGDELPGPPDDNWQEFVAAGSGYQDHLQLHSYPVEGDRCLYCHQELGPAARQLIARYKTFLDKSVARRLEDTSAAVRRNALVLDPAAVANVRSYLLELTSSGDSAEPEWVASMTSLLSDGETVCARTKASQAIESSDLAAVASALLAEVDGLLQSGREDLKNTSEKQANRQEQLRLRSQEANELAAAVAVKANLESIRSYVVQARTASTLSKLASKLSSSVLRPLTELSKVASQDIVNTSFERLFAEECEALNTPSVSLSFQGRSGKAERQKAVATYRPSAVLSEGEQKVLAIADFLAESRLRGVTAPIVFDDPVTSLDYKRQNQIARRISVLAQTHQVIVFTHNIMFASTLLEGRQTKKERATFYEIRDHGDVKGVVSADVEPRMDDPAHIGKEIDKAIAAAAGTTDLVTQDALVERCWNRIRAWMEVFVEQDLLAGVSQRYRANVRLNSIDKIKTERLDKPIKILKPLFEKACRYTDAHSQPAEHLNVHPTLEELQADWKLLCETRNEFKR